MKTTIGAVCRIGAKNLLRGCHTLCTFSLSGTHSPIAFYEIKILHLQTIH